MIVRYIPILELPVLIIMVLMRAALLRKKGIKAMVFGATDKTDFLMIPIIFCFFYALIASMTTLPLPGILKMLFWESTICNWAAIAICTASLVWFGITLKIFGNSFRVGIDENTSDKLITNGTFAVSRNPIYVGFIVFFIGIFLVYPNIVTSFFLILLTVTIHRQIIREEKFLVSFYGDEYKNYCMRVRRYL